MKFNIKMMVAFNQALFCKLEFFFSPFSPVGEIPWSLDSPKIF